MSSPPISKLFRHLRIFTCRPPFYSYDFWVSSVPSLFPIYFTPPPYIRILIPLARPQRLLPQIYFTPPDDTCGNSFLLPLSPNAVPSGPNSSASSTLDVSSSPRAISFALSPYRNMGFLFLRFLVLFFERMWKISCSSSPPWSVDPFQNTSEDRDPFPFFDSHLPFHSLGAHSITLPLCPFFLSR